MSEQNSEQPELPDDGDAQATSESGPNDRIAALERERDDFKDRLARSLADAENARKRQQRELLDSRQYAISQFARDLLEAVDNMERALDGIPPDQKGSPIAAGVMMVADLMLKALKKHGVEPVEALGKSFDPNVHNAIAEDPTDEVAPGTITAEWQRGYRIGDRLLRPAMVRVARGKAKQDVSEGSKES